MRRIEASRRNASALRLRFFQSFASLRQRLSQAKVRSTTQRRGSTTNPFVRSERFVFSAFAALIMAIRVKSTKKTRPTDDAWLVQAAGHERPRDCSFRGDIRIFATVDVYLQGARTAAPSFVLRPWGPARRGVNEMNPGWSPAHERTATLPFEKQTASARLDAWHKATK